MGLVINDVTGGIPHMPPAATGPTLEQDTQSTPDPQEPFVFYQPQYHNGLLTASERLNERRIRMAMMAYGENSNNLIKQSPARLRELLRESQAHADRIGMDIGIGTDIYVKHEELALIAELICLRETYAEKLVAYCKQRVSPSADYTDTMSSLVHFNNRP
jgi:hypothetical protein